MENQKQNTLPSDPIVITPSQGITTPVPSGISTPQSASFEQNSISNPATSIPVVAPTEEPISQPSSGLPPSDTEPIEVPNSTVSAAIASNILMSQPEELETSINSLDTPVTNVEQNSNVPANPSTSDIIPPSNPEPHPGAHRRPPPLKALALITAGALAVVLLVAGISVYVARRDGMRLKSPADAISEQDVSGRENVDNQLTVLGLKSGNRKLVINADVVTRGSLFVGTASNNFFGQLSSTNLSANREYALPDASGTFCLDTNNCNFASADATVNSINGVTGVLTLGQGLAIQGTTIVSTTTEVTQTTINNQAGSITLQGTANQITVDNSGNVVTISTPQDIATSSSPTFAGVTVTTLTVTSSSASLNGLAYTLPNLQGSGVLVNDGSGGLTWTPVGGACPTCFLNGGNSFGAIATLGTNDNNALALETNGVTRLSISNSGVVNVVDNLQVGNGIDVTGTGTFTSTNTSTNQAYAGIASLLTVDPTGNQNCGGFVPCLSYGLSLAVESDATNTSNIGGLVGQGTSVAHQGSGSLDLLFGNITTVRNLGGPVANAVGVGIVLEDTGAIQSAVGLAVTGVNAGATGGTAYGIRIENVTGDTAAYGVAIAETTTQTLWLSGDSGTAASGIGFGSSLDTNLYRSAADVLKTDDSLVVQGAAAIGTQASLGNQITSYLSDLGLSVAASLQVQKEYTNYTAGQYAMAAHDELVVNQSVGNNSSVFVSTASSLEVAAASAEVGTLINFAGITDVKSTNGVSGVIGSYQTIVLRDDVSVSNVQGYVLQASFGDDIVVGDYTGVYLGAPTNTSGIDNVRGIYVADHSGGNISSYNIYSDGTARNYFGGLVQLGTVGAPDTASYLCLNSSSVIAACSSSSATSAFLQGGNSFGAAATLGTNDANSLAFETNGTTYWTLSTAGVLTASNSATISVPGSGANSERFGSGATAGVSSLAVGNSAVAGTQAIALGYSTDASGDNSVAIGYDATAASTSNVAIGSSASTGASGRWSVAIGSGASTVNGVNSQGVAIGSSATTTGNLAVAIGRTATAAANSTALGYAASASLASSIALGYGSTTTAANQLVVGSTTVPISSVFFGNGVTNTSPQGFTLNATGGSGSNIAGAALNIAGGRGTGSAVGGGINFQTTAAGSPGSSANSLATVFSLAGGTGEALFQNTSNSTTALRVLNATGSTTVLGVDTSNTRVGIGTAAPDAALEVTGDVYLSNGANRTIKLENATSGAGHTFNITGSNSSGGSTTGGSIALQAGNGFSSETLTGASLTMQGGGSSAGNVYISSGVKIAFAGLAATVGDIYLQPSSGIGAVGNVGIGISNASAPTSRLQVNTALSSGSILGVTVGGSTTLFTVNADRSAHFLNGTKVGVGTSSPITQLHVAGGLASSTSTLTLAGIQDIAVQGNYAYAIEQSGDDLEIIDISNPASPVIKGTVDTTDNPRDVYVQGRYAYVTGSTTTDILQIFDISNPASPVLTGSVTIADAQRVVVQGRYAYVTASAGTSSYVVDVSNPYSPVVLSTYTLAATQNAVAYQGRYAYVAITAATDTMRVIDMNDPASPLAVGSVNICDAPQNLTVVGRYAYVACAGSSLSLSIYDISDPANPTAAVGSYTFTQAADDVVVRGRYAYVTVAGSEDKLFVIDISNPASPALVESAAVTGNNPSSLAVQGRYAFIETDRFETLELGGAYLQQLEVGGIQATNISSISNGYIGGDLNVQGALTAGRGLNVSGLSQIEYSNTALATTAGDEAASRITMRDVGVVSTGTDNTYGQIIDVTRSGSTGSTVNVYGQQITLNGTSTSGTINNYGLNVSLTGNTNGTSTNYGIQVAASGADNNYGVAIQATSTQTLWISSDADNTTAAAGIAFGSSRDTNLYRSAANTLATDDNVHVALKLQVGNDVAASFTQCAGLFGDFTCDAGIEASHNSTNTTDPTYGMYFLTAKQLGADTATTNYGISNSLGIVGTNYSAHQYTSYNAAINFVSGTTAGITGVYGSINNASGTLTTSSALQGFTQITGGTTATGHGLLIDSASVAGGSLTNNYGIKVNAQTAGGSDYGIAIEAADTQTLWIGSGADSTTAAAGIAFGSSRDTNLYRSAANNLKTDDSLEVATNVGIGTTATVKLDVLSAGADGTTVAQFRNAGATVCTVQPGGTGFACASDERLKTNVATVIDPLDTIRQLRGVTFNWNSDPTGQGQVGFIAQELEQLIPSAVSTAPNGYKVANYQAIIPYLVGATQEQDLQIAGLQQSQGLTATNLSGIDGRIESLEHRMAALEATQGQGNGTDFATLNVSGPATVQSLTVTGAATVSTLTVTGNATFAGNITIQGHILGNVDTRGILTIPAGQTQHTFTFVKPYEAGSEPNVILTPKNTFAPSYRVESTPTDFTVYFLSPAATDVVMNYQVQQ